MNYNTSTNTNTYTVIDVRKTFENCEADFRTIARRTGKWSQPYVEQIMHDVIKLAENGYLSIISIALKRDSDNYTLRATKFSINENGTSNESERAGRNNDWENIPNTSLIVYLTYTTKWFNLSLQEKTDFQKNNNFEINWAPTSDNTTFSHLSSGNAQLYSNKCYELQKTNYK